MLATPLTLLIPQHSRAVPIITIIIIISCFHLLMYILKLQQILLALSFLLTQLKLLPQKKCNTFLRNVDNVYQITRRHIPEDSTLLI
jgi:hypothetical protein